MTDDDKRIIFLKESKTKQYCNFALIMKIFLLKDFFILLAQNLFLRYKIKCRKEVNLNIDQINRH